MFFTGAQTSLIIESLDRNLAAKKSELDKEIEYAKKQIREMPNRGNLNERGRMDLNVFYLGVIAEKQGQKFVLTEEYLDILTELRGK
jgi:hypothetical protein